MYSTTSTRRGSNQRSSAQSACGTIIPQHFRELMANGMRCDNSWNHPGRHYLNVYEHIREK